VLICFLTAGCDPETGRRFELECPVLNAEGYLPEKYTCDGENVSPPFDWFATRFGAMSFALIVEEIDPATGKAGTRVNWIFYNIPPTSLSLPEATSPKTWLGGGGDHGLTEEGPGYSGPCPVRGETVHFRARMFALRSGLRLDMPTREDLLGAMTGRIMATGEIRGKYRCN